jgi:hypothetical protein
MQRRDLLRLLATGAALQLAPHRLFAIMRETRLLIDEQTSLRTLNPHQYVTVKTIAEMIIPRTDTPGATDVKTAEFIDLILTEWYGESERARFLAGLDDVDSRTRRLFAKDFVDCSPLQQSDVLVALGEKMAEETQSPRSRLFIGRGSGPAKDFYAMLRQLTLTAYYTSEAGATGELRFELIPGEYKGCIEPSSTHEEPKK